MPSELNPDRLPRAFLIGQASEESEVYRFSLETLSVYSKTILQQTAQDSTGVARICRILPENPGKKDERTAVFASDVVQVTQVAVRARVVARFARRPETPLYKFMVTLTLKRNATGIIVWESNNSSADGRDDLFI